MGRSCLLLCSALLAAAPALADAPGLESRRPVAVYRGQDTDRAPAVPVFRGSSPHRPAAAAAATPARAQVIEGGSRLWVLDPDAGTLTACRLVGSGMVGRDRIRCTRR